MSTLIRCCYCGDPYVPPPPPSVSSVSSSPSSSLISTTAIDCGRCQVYPIRWEITLDAAMFPFAGSSSRNDCGDLIGTFSLQLRESFNIGITTCRYWGSDDPVVNTNKFLVDGTTVIDPACPELAIVTYRRVNLWSLTNGASAQWMMRIVHAGGYAFGQPSFVWFQYSTTTSTVDTNCVRDFELAYASTTGTPTYNRHASSTPLTITPSP